MKYNFIDEIKSDVMFEAYGKNLKELYENCAEALLSVICKLDKVKKKDVEEFEFKGEDIESTLWNFLSGIIAIVDTEEMFFSKIDVLKADENSVKAKLYGETIKPENGETVVKSLTMYKYGIHKTNDGYKAVVSLDI